MPSPLLTRLWKRRSAAELREAGKVALAEAKPARALRLFDAALKRAPQDGEALLGAGVAHYRLGAFREALSRFERCIELVPSSAEAYCQAANARYALGEPDVAERYCREALEREPAHLETHALLSSMALPGPDYTRLLAALHQRLAPRTYVEIGVDTGDSLALVLPSTRAVGIDPEPHLARPPAPNIRIHAMRSDDYFATRELETDLGGLPVDLAFIDGAHVFDQALRDFINLERHAAPESTILLHDTYPLNRFTSQRTRQSAFWSGDVWRLVLILKKYRPDLTVTNVGAKPTGLCIVRGLDPQSRVLADDHDAIVEEFMAVDYAVLDADKPRVLNLVPNHIERVLEIATAAPRERLVPARA